jgi:AAA15 family ATPase/GTPase
MLIRLTIGNVLSFNTEQEILLTPGKNRNHVHHIIKGEKARDIDILKAAVIYGANASGKSNLIKALALMKRIVLHGGGDTIVYDHFKLDGLSKDRASKLEVEFYINGKYFAYGFTFTKTHIASEWLYTFNKEKDFMVFERTTNGKEVTVTFDNLKLSNKELNNLEFTGSLTKPAECFLHALNNSNVDNLHGIDLLKDAYKWFSDSLTIIFPHTKFGGLEANIALNQTFRDLFEWALDYFDTAIEGIESTEVDFSSSDVDLPKMVKEQIQNDMKIGESGMITAMNNLRFLIMKDAKGDISASKIMTQRSAVNMDGRKINFEISEESDGTQRIMDFIPAIAELQKDDQVFVIDEIERSLHVNLVRKFLSMFFERTQGVKSQLIVTSHESQLMDQDLIRKDEIWLVEKNEKGESEFKSIEDFTVRKDLDIMKAYLQNRFGAVPNFSSMKPEPILA